MCTLYKRSHILNRIDADLELDIRKEEEYWRKVLTRVVSTIKLLSRLGIAFRGPNESEQSDRKRNY